jgi:tetratricopeptide (TPR) repeat protein
MPKWTATTTTADVASFSDDPLVKKLILRYRIRMAVVLLVIAIVVGFGASPTYNWFRNRQIDRNLEAAKAAARIEDWGTARDRARSVLIARPGDFDAFHVWFQALSKMGESRTYMVAMGLFVNPQSTPQDRIDALRVMSLQAPQALAIAAFSSLSEEQKAQTAARVAIAPLLLKRGEIAMAEKMLREAPELETSQDARLALLQVLCASPKTERVAEARGIFARLIAENADSQALDALVLLGNTPGGLAPGVPLPSLPEWIAAKPRATTLHQLFALEPGMLSSPLNGDNVAQRAIDRFLGVDPGTLGTWLIAHGKAAEVVRLLAEPAKTSGTAYIARLHALMREKDFEEITAMLSDAPKAVDLVELELVKATIAHAKGDSSAEKKAWNDALGNAVYDQSKNHFFEIAAKAGMLGVTDVAEDAWVAAVRFGWGQIPLSGDLLPVLKSLNAQERIGDLLAMYRGLLRFEPGNPELIYNFNYLALIADVLPPAEAAKAFEALVAKYPKAPDLHSGLAMAYLMDGRAAAALQQVPLMEKSKSISSVLCHAIEGTALLVSGDSAKGRPILDGLEWKSLMRCESAVFRRMLTKLQIKNMPLPELVLAQPEIDPATVPAWKKALERLEKQHAQDVLPTLPTPKIPGADRVEP